MQNIPAYTKTHYHKKDLQFLVAQGIGGPSSVWMGITQKHPRLFGKGESSVHRVFWAKGTGTFRAATKFSLIFSLMASKSDNTTWQHLTTWFPASPVFPTLPGIGQHDARPPRGDSNPGVTSNNFRLNRKILADFAISLRFFAALLRLQKRPRYWKSAFFQLNDQLFGSWKTRNPLQHNGLRVFAFLTGNQLAVYTRSIAIAASPEVLHPLTS